MGIFLPQWFWFHSKTSSHGQFYMVLGEGVGGSGRGHLCVKGAQS